MSDHPFLGGGGEMGALIRAHDWSNSEIGPPEAWPAPLRTSVRLLLNTGHPMYIWWGPNLLCFYNDAYRQSIGSERHPSSLGRPGRAVWAEIWDTIGPQIDQVMSGGAATWHENQLIPITRNGRREDVYWTYSYSPIDDDTAPNGVGGVLVVCTETTEQVLSAIHAAAQRERFAQVFEQSPSFMAMLLGPNHRIELANPAYLRLVGHRDILGRVMAEALPEAVGQGYLGLLDQVYRSGEAYSALGAKYSVQTDPNGPLDERYLDFVYQPITDSRGIVAGIFVEGVDVTARRAAEQAAHEAGERLEAALSVGHGIGTWDCDVQADRVVADERAARMYGIDPAVASAGVGAEAFFQWVHPDDLPALRQAVDETLRAGGDFRHEYRLVQPDRGNRWLAAQGQCTLDRDQRPARFLGLSFDITERKAAEKRAQALLELDDRFRSIDRPRDLAFAASETLGRTLEVSRAGYGTVDLAAETITIARDWNAPGINSLAGVLNFRDYGSYIEDLKRGETVVFADAFHDPRTQTNAQALKAISAQAVVNMPVTERNGFVALLYLNHHVAREWVPEELRFIRDVAQRTHMAVERRRAEQELRALAADLESQVAARTDALMVAEEALRQSQKMEAVGQLTGGIAHDFNNLLAGISGSLELVEKRLHEGKLADAERFIASAQGASRRAAALTQRLLAFARRQTLSPKPTDINRLIAGMEDLIRRTVGPDVHLEVVGADGLWATQIDPSQLENALLNLCINARDAMAPDGGHLTIETANKWLDARAARERELPPGQYVSVAVTDTGAGMEPQVIARAFDPFFTTKPTGEGTGLGLSMVYGFARQSGGQVRIDSEVGKGTTMAVYLPRHLGAKPDEAASEEEFTGESGAGETVMVIDDDTTVRMLIVEVLRESGYIVIEAVDGPTGLNILQSTGEIALLITDVGLPGGMNGRQVADAARVRSPDLKVLFITGYAENAVIGNGDLAAGMEILTKPFTIAALSEKVTALIAG